MQYNDDGWCGCMTLEDTTFADAIDGAAHLGPWTECTICDVDGSSGADCGLEATCHAENCHSDGHWVEVGFGEFETIEGCINHCACHDEAVAMQFNLPEAEGEVGWCGCLTLDDITFGDAMGGAEHLVNTAECTICDVSETTGYSCHLAFEECEDADWFEEEFGMNCEAAVAANGCDGEAWPEEPIEWFCPVTCDACGGDCSDADWFEEEFGMNCEAAVAANGCDGEAWPEEPIEWFCPITCEVCEEEGCGDADWFEEEFGMNCEAAVAANGCGGEAWPEEPIEWFCGDTCGLCGSGEGVDINGLNCHPETCHNDGHWVEVDFGEFDTIDECQALCGCHPEATSMQYNEDGWCGCMTLDAVTFADAIEGAEHLGPWTTCTICDVTDHSCGAGPSYDFCFGAYSDDTVRQDFETGSAALPDGWTAVDDDPISEPGNWYVIDNTGAALANDGWAAYEASNIWGNYPGDNQLTGSYLMNGDYYDQFIAEFEVYSDDNDGLGFLFGYHEINEHFTATEINDQWPNPPADGYGGPHMKLRQRSGAALPSMNADNNVYSLLDSDDGDDGVSVAKQNYVPYRGSTVMNMALKVECCDGDGNSIVTFLSSRHSTSGEVEGVQRLTGKTSTYTPGRIGLFVYAHTAKFDNFQVTPLSGGSFSGADLAYCEGAGDCNMGEGTCACALAGTAETMPDCSRGITAAGEVVRADALSSGGGGGGGGGGSSDGVVQVSTGASGTTVQLTVTLEGTQSNVYALAGTADTTMTFPAAFQVAAPFGTDIGGVAPAFFAINSAAEFDSWLTVGPTDGTAGAAISASPGLGLDQWTDSSAFSTDNGAIFWMNPADGPTGTVVLAQVTNSGTGSAAAVIQGRSSGGGEDFQTPVSWSW